MTFEIDGTAMTPAQARGIFELLEQYEGDLTRTKLLTGSLSVEVTEALATKDSVGTAE